MFKDLTSVVLTCTWILNNDILKLAKCLLLTVNCSEN